MMSGETVTAKPTQQPRSERQRIPTIIQEMSPKAGGIRRMPVSRIKSCAQCRTAKARCSLTAPCIRCRDRNLTCKYEQEAALSRNDGSCSPRPPRPIAPACRNPAAGGLESGPGLSDAREPAATPSQGQGFQSIGSSCASASNRLGNPESSQMTWEDFDTSIMSFSDCANGGDSLIAQVDQQQAPAMQRSLDSIAEDIALPGEISLPWLAGQLEGGVVSHDRPRHTAHAGLTPHSQGPVSDVESKPRRYKDKLIWPRIGSTIEGYFSNTVFRGQIMSYPQMMSKGNRLPPFIFPRCMMGGPVAFDCELQGVHQCLPEILAICSNMVQLFENRTPASSSFVWKTIYAEHERLRREVSNHIGQH